MKLFRLAIDNEGNLAAIIVTEANCFPEVRVRPLTSAELCNVVDTYNAVAEAAEGSNNLPYQMTFQLLKEEDFVQPVA